MGVSTPETSPYVQQFADYLNRVIRITVVFDNATRAISGGTVFRDANCLYTNVFVGVGPDGSPNTSPRTFAVPAGTTAVGANRFHQMSITTIEDFLLYQITAGT